MGNFAKNLNLGNRVRPPLPIIIMSVRSDMPNVTQDYFNWVHKSYVHLFLC